MLIRIIGTRLPVAARPREPRGTDNPSGAARAPGQPSTRRAIAARPLHGTRKARAASGWPPHSHTPCGQ